MILDGQVIGRPLIAYKDTKANITALSNLVEGMVAYATDVDELGIYNGVTWAWSPLSGIFAAIHVHDASAAQNVATGTTYVKITAFTDNGFSAGCTPDAANDKITITKTGYYKVNGSVSFSDGTNNVTWFASIFLNGVEQDQVHFTRKIGTAGDVGNSALTGIIDVTTAPWDVDLRMRHDNGGTIAITVSYANINVEYVGET